MKTQFLNAHHHSIRFLINTFIIAGSLLLTETVSAAAAGRVVFATGTPEATDTAGTVRTLKRGGEVFSGDTLTTVARSRLQISFADGSYISLQPNSQYLIEEYTYSGKPDGTEKANYNLLKGGVRAVTGLIGKQNPEAYKVKTAVATIGIRGTGHNTRICAGDCGNKKDGLYHNTWEGTTTVTNDADSQDVPAGDGVFVEDKDSPIEPLDQPSGVTAVDSTKEKQEEQEEQISLVSSGEQRTGDEGLQVVIVENEEVIRATGRPDPTFSSVLANQVLQAIGPDINDPESVEASFTSQLSIFSDANGKPIGFLGTDNDDNGTMERYFATSDLAAILGGDVAAAVAEVKALLDIADTKQVRLFLEDPVQLSEFATVGNGTIGLGRFSDGRLLSVNAQRTDIHELTDNQSIHFVYGPDPGDISALTSTSATYNFLGTTQSTSLSGATIGNGVTSGFITVNFGMDTATLSMSVDHNGVFYSVVGPLTLDGISVADTGTLTAMSGTIDSLCYPGDCRSAAHVKGAFAGPLNASNEPKHLGISYDIRETDPIIGAAVFGNP